jgi:hypothetical protein
VLVSTGGWIEYVLTQGRATVDRYIRKCRDLGFDISTGPPTQTLRAEPADVEPEPERDAAHPLNVERAGEAM